MTRIGTEIIRRNRRTRTTITVYREEFLGRWITICEDHGGYCEHRTRAEAVSWIAEPTMWCPGCQETQQ